MTIVFAIKDLRSGLFYQRRPINGGFWASLHGAYLFHSLSDLEDVLRMDRHRVEYPGGREVVAITIRMEEV